MGIEGLGGEVTRSLIKPLEQRIARLIATAERYCNPKALEHLAQVAEGKGAEGLAMAARFRKLEAINAQQLPLTLPEREFVVHLLDGKAVGTSSHNFKELAAHAPEGSGTKKLAETLEQVTRRLNESNHLYETATSTRNGQLNLLHGSLGLSDTQVVSRAASILLRLELPAQDHAAAYLCRDLKSVLNDLKGRPGVTPLMKRHIEAALERVDKIKPSYEHWAAYKPQSEEMFKVYRQLFSVLAEHDPAHQAQALFAKLLDDKMARSEGWQVFTAETWQQLQASHNSQVGLSFWSNTDKYIERSLFEKAENSATVGGGGGTIKGSSNGKLLQPVALPVGNTGVTAPQVTPRHVLENPGDYIVFSRGKLHVVNRDDMGAWFRIAEQDAR